MYDFIFLRGIQVADKNNRKSIFDDIPDRAPEKSSEDAAAKKRASRKKWKKINRVLDRIAGFIIVTVLVIGFSGLAFEYMCIKGPSEAFSTKWFQTFAETRRFQFINNLFLTEQEVAERTVAQHTDDIEEIAMTISEANVVDIVVTEATDEWEVGGYKDDDNDGIIYFEFKSSGSQCYMIAIKDPKRLFVGMPDAFGGSGLMLEDMISKYGALGGTNAGGFYDDNGGGTGGFPEGITIVDGVIYNDVQSGAVAGFDANGILYVDYYNIEECKSLGMINAVSFNPALVIHGQPTYVWDESGANPRTAIGQREDGTVLMLCVDGRQFFSPGLNYEEVAWLMIDYGAVNAINMDGGSSSCMMYEGELKNNPTNLAGGTRYLPTAWLFR